MYEHGVGVPVDLHLAKRHYDESLAFGPDGTVPVRLALFKLWFRQVAPVLVVLAPGLVPGLVPNPPLLLVLVRVLPAATHCQQLWAEDLSHRWPWSWLNALLPSFSWGVPADVKVTLPTKPSMGAVPTVAAPAAANTSPAPSAGARSSSITTAVERYFGSWEDLLLCVLLLCCEFLSE